ncbi:lipid asymmetry maintenance protein MlaB [Shewanella waksmanii]|uniref:STAS domain-containing protein n=1 Tax=Shewanella waksmanii TaxID=213783 RepID=UPI0037367C4E
MDCLLEEVLDISSVSQQKTTYLTWLKHHTEANTDLKIHGDQVARVDAAGIQLLASLFYTAKQHNINIDLLSSSETLSHAIKILGYDDRFINMPTPQ